MRITDIFKRKNNKNIPNKYYKGNNRFEFKTTGETIKLEILDELKEFPNVYECSLKYSSDTNGNLKGFEKVYIGFNKDKMINDESYTNIVFVEILDKARIEKLYDIEFKKDILNKNGNYIGSLIDGNVVLDENIGIFIEALPATEKLKDKYYDHKIAHAITKKELEENWTLKKIHSDKETLASIRETVASLVTTEEESKKL